MVNVLSVMATKAVQTIYEEEGKLPKSIEVPASLILAIPASEYEGKKARFLESRFKENVHIVMYVGEEKVTVQIEFETVKVTREGIPALYAIFEGIKICSMISTSCIKQIVKKMKMIKKLKRKS